MAGWQKLTEELFEVALTLKATERSAFLDEACNGDSELKHTVEDLLAEDARAGSFLLHLPVDLLPGAGSNGASIGEKVSCLQKGDSSSVQKSIGRLSPGQVLNDRFCIVRFIAKGGMAEVYEAEDRFLQRAPVALKTILPHFANDPGLQQRFEREIVLAREVVHPNLCPIYDIFHCEEEQPGFLFLTMKLLAGETLAARLKRPGAISFEEGTAILKQLVAGLAAIHAQGVIHCDIKPNNIMLDGTGPDVRLFITDFGLARASESETTLLLGETAIAGTPYYMAPELLLGQPPNQASDIFALGVVLHEVFTGHKPSMSLDTYSVLVGPQLESSNIQLPCVQLIAQFLDGDPKRRCEAFEHALDWIAPNFLRSRRARLWWYRHCFGARFKSPSTWPM